MKNTFGKIGFFLGVTASLLLLVAIPVAILLMLLMVITFGFIDNPGPIFTFVSKVLPGLCIKLSFFSTIVGLFFSILAKLIPTNDSSLIAHNKVKYGLILNFILSGVFFISFLFYQSYIKSSEKDFEMKIEKAKTAEYGCVDSEVCEDFSFLKETNVLSFTLKNAYADPITLNALYDTGSCSGGVVEEYQKENSGDPVIINARSGFNIPVDGHGRVKIKIQCQAIVPQNETGHFGGQIGFDFTEKAGRNVLKYHIYLKGPLLK